MNIGKRYEKYSDEVQEVIFLLTGGKKSIEDEFVPSLDLLALNYDLLFKAKQDVDANGSFITDSKQRSVKSPSVQIIYSSMNVINQILKSFPTNPMSRARLKSIANEDNNDEDFEDMIDNL